MKRITLHLRQWWSGRKQQAIEKDILQLANSFQVTERNGNLYLVNEGTAFCIIPSDALAYQIVELLRKAREAAADYHIKSREE
jgi:hypothetical protein